MPRKKHFEFSWKEEFSQEVRAARLWTKKKLPAHMSNYLGRISSSGGHHGHKLRTQWPNLARGRRFKLAWSRGTSHHLVVQVCEVQGSITGLLIWCRGQKYLMLHQCRRLNTEAKKRWKSGTVWLQRTCELKSQVHGQMYEREHNW